MEAVGLDGGEVRQGGSPREGFIGPGRRGGVRGPGCRWVAGAPRGRGGRGLGGRWPALAPRGHGVGRARGKKKEGEEGTRAGGRGRPMRGRAEVGRRETGGRRPRKGGGGLAGRRGRVGRLREVGRLEKMGKGMISPFPFDLSFWAFEFEFVYGSFEELDLRSSRKQVRDTLAKTVPVLCTWFGPYAALF